MSQHFVLVYVLLPRDLSDLEQCLDLTIQGLGLVSCSKSNVSVLSRRIYLKSQCLLSDWNLEVLVLTFIGSFTSWLKQVHYWCLYGLCQSRYLRTHASSVL